MADHGRAEKSLVENPSPGIKDRCKDLGKRYALKFVEILLQVDKSKLSCSFGSANLRDEVVKSTKEEPVNSRNQPGRPCKPYPFERYHYANRYIENDILYIRKSGALNFTEPCHQYIAFINIMDETKINTVTTEVIRFAAACMNSRTNGTIHFGIGDKPDFIHGQVLGVVVKDKEAYANELKSAIDLCFEHKHKQTAQFCIKPPRFVGVLNMTSSDKYVIEVDIVPDSTICGENIYHTLNKDTKKATKKAKGKTITEPQKQFFVRDGGSSRDLLASSPGAEPMVEYNQFVDGIAQLTQLRKQSEEKRLNVIKSSTQGSRLSQMITGGSLSLDKSHFERYVIVTNKSHPVQFESLGFLAELNPTPVLDFDPESAKHVLQCHFEQQSTVNVHLPAKYKITGVEDIANKLELTRNNQFVDGIAQLTQLQKQSEEKRLNGIKGSTQGLRSSHMIFDCSFSFDKDPSPGSKNWRKHEEEIFTLELARLFKVAKNTLSLSFGPAKLTIQARDEVMKSTKEEPISSRSQPGRLCKPYPFLRYRDSYRYMESSILYITESGALDFIEPCHEYKAFINTTDVSQKLHKFILETIRFAAACMNSRTNGTIHFGIGDRPKFIHGQVLGVVVGDKEAYANELKSAIDGYFEHKHKQTAQICIKPPRFVSVLNKDNTTSNTYVIEVDIVPDSTICGENIYHTFNMDAKNPKKQFLVRDGSSSRDLLAPTTCAKPMVEYNQFVGRIAQLTQLRKQSEEKHLNVKKSSTQGSRLSQMITGGSLSLDKSHFERYVIVTNKSHPVQFESLGFLAELNPTAVLDFDPESAKHGLQCHLEQQSTVNVHLPAKYKITEGVEDIANKLELTRNTSWVFCNGGIEDEVPSDTDKWLKEKGASIRDVISILCQKDVLPNKRYLVIFLLLSTVSDEMDPLVETFSAFFKELKGTEQILCICDNENAFISWRDLINARCGIDISSRCIYELSFAEVNGTILSLLSENRLSKHFLTCGGGSKVHLTESVEQSLNTLEILCVNQEDKFDFNTVMAELCSQINLMFVPGCGGTTLAMHTLWSLLDRFRCAVLRDCNADFTEVAEQVVKLLMSGHEEQVPRVPVLLMIDDFDDRNKVFDLQQVIYKECAKKAIQGRSPQVILLNCPLNPLNRSTPHNLHYYTVLAIQC